MFRFVRYIQDCEQYIETKSEKKFLEISKGRMEVTVVVTGFAKKYRYSDWLALDILNACEADGLVRVDVAHVDKKTKNELKVITITPKTGQDFATWTGFAEFILGKRNKLQVFIFGLFTTGIVYGLFRVVRFIIGL